MTYTPVAPPAPAARPPAAPRRRRRRWVLLVALVALLADVAFALTVGRCPSPGTVVSGAYTPAFDRTLEHAGGTTPLDSDQIEKIAANAGIYTFSKFSDNWNLQAQFDDADKLKAAAAQHGNDIKIYEYYNTSFWYLNNNDGWGQYADGFKTSWYLDDDSGKPIEFHGIGHSANQGDDAIGYMIDLRSAAYRSWAVKTLVAWVKAAPLAGINFDSAQPMVGDQVRSALGDGTSSYDELLCGSGASSCDAVDAWNQGMRTLLQQASAALNPLGVKVVYNGVEAAADDPTPTPNRNLGLMAVTDGANNEDFCVKASALSPNTFTPLPVRDDIDMMVAQNADGKVLTEITNYQTDEKAAQGPYCLAAFLMGWEPNMDYWTFHENYNDPLDGDYPKFPEVNLNLGAPSGPYTAAGGLLSRSFAHGFVAVNTGTDDQRIRLPQAGVVFADGTAHETVAAGDTVTLAPRQAQFFLWSSFVAGAPTAAAACR